jgi:hypothetical protein
VEVFCVEQLRRLPAEVDVPSHMLRRSMIALGVVGQMRRDAMNL